MCRLGAFGKLLTYCVSRETALMIKSKPRFDIFSGSLDNDAMWIECVPGLEKARDRMAELSAQIPGRYFVFSIHSRTILAHTDTTKNFIRPGNQRKSQGAA